MLAYHFQFSQSRSKSFTTWQHPVDVPLLILFETCGWIHDHNCDSNLSQAARWSIYNGASWHIYLKSEQKSFSDAGKQHMHFIPQCCYHCQYMQCRWAPKKMLDGKLSLLSSRSRQRWPHQVKPTQPSWAHWKQVKLTIFAQRHPIPSRGFVQL